MIATVTIGFIVTVAIVLLNLYVDVVVSCKHSKKYTLHALWFDCNFAPA